MAQTVRAAEYVRMSTDHQRYSTEIQADAIHRYAATRGIEVVRTYADHGCSGLSISGRTGLQTLLDDVREGRADYSLILVYAVSRWGRFQDADESAFYEHQCTDLDRPWSRGAVHAVLTNEKYAGHNVWNRTSCKLGGARIRNEPAMWIRRDDIFPPLVGRMLFEAAGLIIRERSRSLSDEAMLDALRGLLARRVFLSGLVIDEAEEVPSSSAYTSRFGSLLRAYQLVGFTLNRDFLYVAVIAGAQDEDVQQVLQSAYEQNLLSGSSLQAARRLVAQRRARGKGVRAAKPKALTVYALLRTYQADVDRKRVLTHNAKATHSRLSFIVEAMRSLLADEGFTTLLRAEGLLTLPRPLGERLGGAVEGG